MAHRVTKRRKAVVAGNVHPHYRETIATLSRYADDAVVALSPVPQGGEDILSAIDGETSCVVVQSPDVFGNIVDLKPIAEKAHAAGALLIAVFTEVVSLGLIEPPGAQGADIVVGEASPSATRSPSAGLMWACSPPARSMCARCPAASPARRWTPAASAASC